uniref:Putative NAC domain class transcription factor n=1 Tax=Tamarix hispida TaxID=189793 RepID=T2CB21_9CARY|nr:putative NAC domain class transcription factor [Tamarix hispida]
MCPSAIDTYWTDEDIGLLLDRVQGGTDVPSNVFTDINPHMYHPSNLPDGCWYFLRRPFTKEIKFGFWEAKGDACHIYSSPRVTGWRTTLEFYEGKCPNNHKTDWIMQEYKIILNAPNSPEGNGLLCRVFLCHGGSVDHGLQQNQNGENFSGHDSISPANNRKSSSLQNKRQVGFFGALLSEISVVIFFFFEIY